MHRKLSTDEYIAVDALQSLLALQNEGKGQISSQDDNSADEDGSSSDSENSNEITGAILEDHVGQIVSKINEICPNNVKSAVAQAMENIVNTVLSKNISKWSFDYLNSTYFDKNQIKMFRSKEEKEFEFNFEATLKAGLVFGVYLLRDDRADDIVSEYSQYPSFTVESIDAEEIGFLTRFRNMMQVALKFIPARRNKMLLLAICSLLEGSNRMYITGGTQSLATTRRMLIFEHESGLQRSRRPHRKKRDSEEERSEARKATIKCTCGSIIRKRTLWKHVQSKKHILFSSSSTSSYDPPAEPSST